MFGKCLYLLSGYTSFVGWWLCSIYCAFLGGSCLEKFILAIFSLFLWYNYLNISFLKNKFYCYSITVIWLFSPSLHPTPAKPTSHPHLHPPPWFCPCVLYSSSCNPLSSLSPPHSPLAFVRLFLTSMSLVIFCLLFFSFTWIRVFYPGNFNGIHVIMNTCKFFW